MAQRDQHGTLRDKFNRVIKCEKDFRTAELRHDDGTIGHYRAGKRVDARPSTTAKAEGAASVPTDKETGFRVKKPLDVHARALNR